MTPLEEIEETWKIIRTLEKLADGLKSEGFPTEPFIVQTDPGQGNFQFFLVLHRTATNHRKTVIQGIGSG